MNVIHPSTHGAVTLGRVLASIPVAKLDQRTGVGNAVRRLHRELLIGIGGDAATPMAAEYVEHVARLAFVARQVGVHMLATGADGKGRPVVTDDGVSELVNDYANMVTKLGKAMVTLAELAGLERTATDITPAAALKKLRG